MLHHIFIVSQRDWLSLIKLFAFHHPFYKFYTFWYKAHMLSDVIALPITFMLILIHSKMK